MNRLLAMMQLFQQFAKNNLLVLGTTTSLGLLILYLNNIHHRFVVYPDANGRSNKQNSLGYRHPSNRGMQSQDIEIVSEGNITLRGWYMIQDKAEHLLLYYHQNAGNIGGRLYFIQELMRRIKTNVLIVAYRGFSDSDGAKKPNEREIMIDSAAIMRKANQLSQRDKLSLFVLGRSLGGAASIGTLSQPTFKNAAKGLILQNTFTSIKDVVWHLTPSPLFVLYPLIWLVTFGSYDSISKLPKVHTPILFIKGCKDQLIPKAQMDRLHRLYQGLKRDQQQLQVKTGSHNDTWIMGGEEYFETVRKFMEQCSKL